MSRAYAIVASTHRGKSRFIKKRLRSNSKVPHLVLDIKGEYDKFFTFHSTDREEFAEFIDEEKVSNHFIVLEEASFYLSRRHYSTKIEKILVNKWKSNNTFFIVFHSIYKINPFCFDYLDGVVLFHTKDKLDKLQSSKDIPDELIEGFKEVQQKVKTNKHYNKLILLDDI